MSWSINFQIDVSKLREVRIGARRLAERGCEALKGHGKCGMRRLYLLPAPGFYGASKFLRLGEKLALLYIYPLDG